MLISAVVLIPEPCIEFQLRTRPSGKDKKKTVGKEQTMVTRFHVRKVVTIKNIAEID